MSEFLQDDSWLEENERRGVCQIEVALLKDVVTISLDTSGDALAKRGYRPGILQGQLDQATSRFLSLPRRECRRCLFVDRRRAVEGNAGSQHAAAEPMDARQAALRPFLRQVLVQSSLTPLSPSWRANGFGACMHGSHAGSVCAAERSCWKQR